ncbi:hypothetical protein GOP47_0027923 [Adiantum capillus-veneris]|nr:hypothetical protein GOP47_0027923 [Adiantum capillus-veneris]
MPPLLLLEHDPCSFKQSTALSDAQWPAFLLMLAPYHQALATPSMQLATPTLAALLIAIEILLSHTNIGCASASPQVLSFDGVPLSPSRLLFLAAHPPTLNPGPAHGQPSGVPFGCSLIVHPVQWWPLLCNAVSSLPPGGPPL